MKIFKNRTFQIILVILLILAIPIAVYLAQQQQKLRSRAATAGNVSLLLDPSSRDNLQTSGSSASFSVDLVLNIPTFPQGVSVSTIGSKIQFDITKLRLQTFRPSTTGVRFSDVLMPTLVNSINNSDGTFQFMAVDKTTNIISGRVVLGTLDFTVINPGNSNITFISNQSQYTLSSDNKLFIPNTSNGGPYSTAGSPAPSVSPGPTAFPSPGPRIRGDAAVTADRCVDVKDYNEWLLETTRRSPRLDADWAGGAIDIGNNIKPDGIVDPRDRDAWLEECLYGQNVCPGRNCYGD